MAIKSTLRWIDLIGVLEGRSNRTSVEPRNTSKKRGKSRYSVETLKMVERMLKPKIEKTERGVYFSVTINTEQLFSNTKQNNPNEKEKQRNLLNPVFKGTNPFAYAGQSLAKITQANSPDILAIGAPGYGPEGTPQQGAVFLLKNGKISARFGEKLFSKFGWQVVTAHFDNDPYEDLIGKIQVLHLCSLVSAPSYTSRLNDFENIYPRGGK